MPSRHYSTDTRTEGGLVIWSTVWSLRVYLKGKKNRISAKTAAQVLKPASEMCSCARVYTHEIYMPSKWRVWASIFLFRVSVLTKRISQLFSGRGNPKECKSDSEGGGVRKRSPGRENDMDTGSQPICILGSKLTLIQEVKVYSMTATAQEVSSFECDGSCKPLWVAWAFFWLEMEVSESIEYKVCVELA